MAGRKTPRVVLVIDRSEFNACVESGLALGFGPDDWCYQEPLSLDPQDNVSVCGWHDSMDPRYVATH